MKSNLAFLAVVSVASIGINKVESVESKLRGSNITPIIAKAVDDSRETFGQNEPAEETKSFSFSGGWVAEGWSKDNREEGEANEKVDLEERKSANVEFTGDWVIREWSKNNNEEEFNEQVEQHEASSNVVENKKENFPIRWKKSNDEEVKMRKSKVDSSSDSEIKWTRSTPIKNEYHSYKIKA